MDMLPANIISMFIFSLKTIILLTSAIVVAINYFHSREARKMESKLNVVIPGSIQLVLSFQLIISIIFLFVATILFIIL